MRKSFILLATSLSLSALASVNPAALPELSPDAHLDLNAIQSALVLNHATWKARATTPSKMTKAEMRRMLGSLEAPDAMFSVKADDKAMRAQTDFGIGQPAATRVDWREQNGKSYVSPILNQGNCGSCVAFAAVATLETQANISNLFPNLNPRFAPQALFACGGGGCDSGWYPSSAAQYLQRAGVPDEACAPYTMGATGEDVECSSICSDSAQRSQKTVRTTTPSSGWANIEAVKAALAKGPLMTTLNVYADFMTYSSGVYKHVTGEMLGGHAISIVGYDANERSWIIRNSWGQDWGEKGFARVSWDDASGVGAQTWGFELPTNEGYVSIRSPRSEYYSKDFDVNVESSIAGFSRILVSIKGANGQFEGSCMQSPCSVHVPFDALAEGRYDVVARVERAGKATIASQHEQLAVVKSEPRGDLRLIDVPATLSARVEFKVKASASPAPFQKLTFHARGPNNSVIEKHIDTVLADMTLGWRTNLIPNGNYEIWISAEMDVSGQNFAQESAHQTVTVTN
ncbi:MAG: C1 family peptidase [Bdellovibrionota bacterium]